MMKKDILSRYCWILNVLESCKTDEQIETTQKLFNNFLKLHDSEITDSNISSFKKVFENEKKSKCLNLKSKKSKNRFGFKMSKFFLF